MSLRIPVRLLVGVFVGCLLGCLLHEQVLYPPSIPDFDRAAVLQAVDLVERKDIVPGMVIDKEVAGQVRGYSRWRGRVVMVGDVLVPRGSVLVIDPGTVIEVVPSQTTKTPPEFLSSETELLIRGRLEIHGTENNPVWFRPEQEDENQAWAGIILVGDGASAGTLKGVRIEGAEQGLTLVDASPFLEEVIINDCSYGLVTVGQAKPKASQVRIENVEYGLVGGSLEGIEIVTASERGVVPPKPVSRILPPRFQGVSSRLSKGVRYLGRDKTFFITDDTVWDGRVIVDGVVQITAGATLTIKPGTRVEFTPFDLNHDDLGDSQIIVSGGLRVLGDKDHWVFFGPTDKNQGPGSWGMVSLLASDREDNLIRYAWFEGGYRGFHNHFSTCLIEDSVFTGNFRGLQFQEADMTLKRSWVIDNVSGFRFRDSEFDIGETTVSGNLTALSFLRSTGKITDCRITENLLEGAWIRESGEMEINKSVFQANRRGLRERESRLTLLNCLVSGNTENGCSFLRGEIRGVGNLITGNGLDGVSVTDADLFLMGNDIIDNGAFAIDNQGKQPVKAAGNWWGSGETAVRDKIIDPGLGPVTIEPKSPNPLSYWSGKKP